MKDVEQRVAAKQFADYWQGKGYEKGQSQPYWLSLLRDVYGVEHPEQYINFEEKVVIDNTSFIDGIIPSTRVLIEQKSIEKELDSPIRQSDGTLLTPFQQAKKYIVELPLSQHPRWVITCNFRSFNVYDMERPGGEPEVILLENLHKEYYRLSFLTDTRNEHVEREKEISLNAGNIVGLLYDAFEKQYVDPNSERALKSLNILCVRLVFCLYAEDAGIFGRHSMFHDYMAEFDVRHSRNALIDLFLVLDTLPADRDPYLDASLAAFPYVNGGLFNKEEIDIEIPHFTEEIRELLLNKASKEFDWSEISPTIFGAVFESTLNPETRRSGGMHYTSIENIHKVIDPLFYNDLLNEFTDICSLSVERTKMTKLRAFKNKLASLTFLDPACGSGNFLTETYLTLRRLENNIIRILQREQISFGDVLTNLIQVSISQFYGIEVNDFAVSVAKTALWIAESQMMKETEGIVRMQLDYLPLKTNVNIVEENSLRVDWDTVVPKYRLSYIMGNPPFVGGMMMTREQKSDVTDVFGGVKGVGELDYVSAWYKKSSDYMKGTNIRAAFVSTNSIVQGQQAVTLWKPILSEGITINFAYRTFIWNNEVKDTAAVHCVIIGFSFVSATNKFIFISANKMDVKQINSYLVEAPNIFVESRSKPLCSIPQMRFGSMPRDGGGFILSDEEKDDLIMNEPLSDKWIRPYIGSYEFINNKKRWCLWLVGANPREIKLCPTVLSRIENIRRFRANSVAAETRKFADTPTLFCQIAQPKSDYIAIPIVSSERRRYVPIGFLPATTIASNLLFLIPEASLYHFGILTSNVHNAWMRAVCGRLKSDYRYSKDIVYNNFPWAKATDIQKLEIERHAKFVLDTRNLFPDSSLADLYDPTSMPPELIKAHQILDRAVMKLYGLIIGQTTEADCVATLMDRYQLLVESVSN